MALYLVLLVFLIQAEAKKPGTSITSFLDALWFSIVTLTGVGYGDKAPVSLAGRALSLVFIVGSLGVLGYLVGRVSAFIHRIREDRMLGYGGTTFEQHIVIVGCNRFAKAVLDQICGTHIRIALITDQKSDVELIRESYDNKDLYLLYADFSNFQMLHKANINRASVLFINFGTDSDKLVYLINCRKHFKSSLKYAIVPENTSLYDTFTKAGASYILAANRISARVISSYIFEPDVAEFSEDLLSTSRCSEEFDIKEFLIVEANPYHGKYYNDVFYLMKQEYDSILIGLARQEKGEYQLFQNPKNPKLRLESGDYLILITNNVEGEKIRHAFAVNEGRVNV